MNASITYWRKLLVPREFRCTICLVNDAAKQRPPATLGSGWDRKVFWPSPWWYS